MGEWKAKKTTPVKVTLDPMIMIDSLLSLISLDPIYKRESLSNLKKMKKIKPKLNNLLKITKMDRKNIQTMVLSDLIQLPIKKAYFK